MSSSNSGNESISSNSSNERQHVQKTSQPKKKPRRGKLSEATKKIRALSHISGEDCHCFRYKCFKNINSSERAKIIKNFNLLGDKNSQDSYIAGLITVMQIKQRRPRKKEDSGNFHQSSYCYRIRSETSDIPVCYKAFLSIHGITNQRVCTIKKSLLMTGLPPKDGRGKHTNRKHKMKAETLEKVKSHIESMKGRRAHYSIARNDSKLYLPEELNIKKLYNMYSELNPMNSLSYESYRSILQNNYNISFSYPRSDTCSNCDQFQSEKSSLKTKLTVPNLTEEQKSEIKTKIKEKKIQNKLHLIKANTFYKRKREAKKLAQQNKETEAICFDFMKNLQVPNISTNDVYYRRQLSFYMFNIHVLSNGESFFFTYDETIAKKGSDDVTSMLDNFFKNKISSEVRKLHLFCDSCPGQNKNFTVIRFLHSLVNSFNRFDSIRITFPARGHSYMECDKNMGLIKQNVRIELPDEWNDHVKSSRVKPSPFVIIKCKQDFFKKWGSYLEKILYKKKSPFATKPISEINITKEQGRTLQVRNTYNGPWDSYIMRYYKNTSNISQNLEPSYTSLLPLSSGKYNDLMVLKKFCRDEAQRFFEALPHSNQVSDTDDNY